MGPNADIIVDMEPKGIGGCDLPERGRRNRTSVIAQRGSVDNLCRNGQRRPEVEHYIWQQSKQVYDNILQYIIVYYNIRKYTRVYHEDTIVYYSIVYYIIVYHSIREYIMEQ